MVERHHYFRLDASSRARRAEIAADCRRVLPNLTGVIACAVGTPADDQSAAAWDLSIVLCFATMADLESYRADPAHKRFAEETLAPYIEVRKIWNFDVG